MENLKGKKSIKLYHGSDVIVDQPEYGKGKLNNDYGRGFYCTEDINLAREWACAKNNDGYVNMYELDISEMNILNLNSSKYNILNWLAVLTDNRTYWQNGSVAEEAKRYLREHFLIDISDYDVIIGYRADDSYFSFAQDFVAGVISLQKLSAAMRYGKLGEQIVLKSQKAFQTIKYTGNENASHDIYYVKKVKREKQARKEYRMNKKEKADINDLYMLDIMREGIENGDARLSV